MGVLFPSSYLAVFGELPCRFRRAIDEKGSPAMFMVLGSLVLSSLVLGLGVGVSY